MLSVEGDTDAAVEARIRVGWNKFRQLVPLLTSKDLSLIRRGKLYDAANEMALQRAEVRMVRWMCGVKLKDRVSNKELRERN